MANKSYYLQPKRGAGKIIAATACVLALAAGACAVGVGTSGFKDWSFSRWFPKEEVIQTAPDTENGGAVMSEGENNGMRLMSAIISADEYEEYGVSALAENAYSFNVTYMPEDTTYIETTYTIKFEDPYSDWARGKIVTDYATITQSAKGSTDAVFSVLQPFCERIVVTATYDRNTELKASTIVDYVGTLNYEWSDDFTGILNDCTAEFDFWYADTSFSNGTLCPEKGDDLSITVDLSWIGNQIAQYGYEWNGIVTYNVNLEEDDGDWNTWIGDMLLKAGGRSGDFNSDENKEWRVALSKAMGLYSLDDADRHNEDSCPLFYNVKIVSHRVYNGVDYGDMTIYESLEGCELNDWGYLFYEIPASSISTDTPYLVTG